MQHVRVLLMVRAHLNVTRNNTAQKPALLLFIYLFTATPPQKYFLKNNENNKNQHGHRYIQSVCPAVLKTIDLMTSQYEI